MVQPVSASKEDPSPIQKVDLPTPVPVYKKIAQVATIAFLGIAALSVCGAFCATLGYVTLLSLSTFIFLSVVASGGTLLSIMIATQGSPENKTHKTPLNLELELTTLFQQQRSLQATLDKIENSERPPLNQVKIDLDTVYKTLAALNQKRLEKKAWLTGDFAQIRAAAEGLESCRQLIQQHTQT